MSAIAFTDRVWFGAHPDRQYRVRPALDHEHLIWIVPTRAGWVRKAIVRKYDAASFLFACEHADSFDSWSDEDLASGFDEDLDREALR